MAHTVTTKYNPATGKITAKCWRASVRVEAYSTKAISGELPAHRAALEKLLAKLNADGEMVKWFEVAAAEGIKANEYTFVIDTRLESDCNREYRVMWQIDTTAGSYEEAADYVHKTYFAQGTSPYFEVKAKGDKYPVVVDLA